MSIQHTLFAPVPLGLERVLAAEIISLGASNVRQVRAGVSFRGDLATAYRVCLWSRVASRVLLRIAEVAAPDPDALYENVAGLAWEDHVPATGTLAIDVTASRSPITHTGFATLRVKDGVVDRLRERFGVRPDIDTVAPDVRLNVALRGEKATIALDLGGEGLHRRGYRAAGEQTAAPLKETLAAGVLLLAEWPEKAAEGGAFCDPMCGSGTLVLEAALMACDIAPGLLRERWGFSGWGGHDAATWDSLVAEAVERREAGLSRDVRLLGSDIDQRAIGLAKGSAGRAGVSRVVRFDVRDLREASPPKGSSGGLVACNPPYGERLGDSATGLRDLYAALGERLRTAFGGWRACVITGAEETMPALGLLPTAEHETFNGRIPVRVIVSDLPAAGAAGASGGAAAGAPAGSGAEMFANRLRKNARHIGKWARRTGVTCYRVYDADLPEYAVAIDLYAGAGPDGGRLAAHVAEYAPPATIDPDVARRRLHEAVAVTADVLGLPPAHVHLKVRRRQKGSAQYTRQARTGETMVIAEGGLLFEVNLADYLDTGIFLDHRPTRSLVRDLAGGRRFLNLFAYTGTASVYAAAGGAASTTTVDLSTTYLDWAERNMLLNGITGGRHTRVRADTAEWLDRAAKSDAEPFGLIFCDPPTFSNSKRMEGTFDVQRDHAGLIAAIEPLLSSDGILLFSNNRRKFTLDTDAVEALELSAEEITAESIPTDFERHPRVHNLWRIVRQEGVR